MILWYSGFARSSSKLAANNTSREEHGVSISEEASWVCLDLCELETSSSVDWWVRASDVDASREGTLQTTLGASVLVVTDWVREGDSWRSTPALRSLMNMCGSLRWR